MDVPIIQNVIIWYGKDRQNNKIFEEYRKLRKFK